jgi:hypothetical protein
MSTVTEVELVDIVPHDKVGAPIRSQVDRKLIPLPETVEEGKAKLILKVEYPVVPHELIAIAGIVIINVVLCLPDVVGL